MEQSRHKRSNSAKSAFMPPLGDLQKTYRKHREATGKPVGEAIEAYEKEIALHPDNLHLYLEMARLLSQSGEHQAAIAYCHKALERKPDFAREYIALSRLFEECGDTGGFVRSVLQAIGINPNDERAHTILQHAQIEDTQLNDEIIKSYQTFIEQSPEAYLLWGNLGDALMLQGKRAQAIEAYRQGCYLQTTQKRPELSRNQLMHHHKATGPDYIIIGVSKCGTSSLHRYIGDHPNVLLPHKKDLHFFGDGFKKGVDWYLAQFPAIADRLDFVTGEASPGYFQSPDAHTRVKSLFPETKFIAMLRNPVDRAVSWYHHNARRFRLTAESLDAIMKAEIEQLASIPESEYATARGHLADGMYFYKFKRWMSSFPQEQFLVIKSEDFYENAASTMHEVFDFLALPPYEAEHYPIHNAGGYPPTDEALKETLRKFFRPHNEKLSTFLSRDFSWDERL